MKFYCFGDEVKPVILLLPGTCCHWKRNFGHVLPLLERDFHVVCASYDGFDETENTVFPDMLTETEKIEDYIQKNFGGRICAALRALSSVHRTGCLCHPQCVSGRGVRLLEPLLDGLYRDVFRQSGGFLWPGLVVPREI